MSPREKNLLALLGIGAFVVLNFIAFNFYQSKSLEVERKRNAARQQVMEAEMFRNSGEQILDEMEWLRQHEPEPAAYQDIQTRLQQFSEAEARAAGLTIKAQKLLPTETGGTYYHRAQIEFTVTGNEEALYRWFDRLNNPEDFRSAVHIRLSPNNEDDTKIDCTSTVSQWFIPSV